MRRILTMLATLSAALLLTLTLAAPANAASGWQDAQEPCNNYNTTITYIIQSGDATHEDLARVKLRVQFFSNTDTCNLGTVSAVRGACSIRNLNTTRVSGVKIDSCRLGRYAGTSLTEAGPFLDGGTCCANGESPLRFAHYDGDPGNIAFLAACTCSYRSRSSGVLYSSDLHSDPTSDRWVFN